MRHRLLVGLPAIILLFFGLSGTPTGPTHATTDDADEALKTFTQILSLVEENYVDEVSSQDLVYGAIRGMLGQLDPHCSFLDPKSYQEMQEEQRGSFSGLGIVISLRGEDKDLTVISPIDGTPAHRAGIRAGDVISHIEGTPTTGITIDEALEKLRGPKGSRVSISIHREGVQELLDFDLVRDDIPTASIPYAFMLTKDVGYIRVKNFSQTTSRELDDKIHELRKEGMDKLVLDLRWNPGGLLDQAVKVSERFLKPRDLIVYTKGRIRDSFQEFRSARTGGYEDLPLVVLVNRGSASASEIVAGAIQDHDRGLILGETTWGKGLVQTVYRLSQSAGLALTTAKYYTPSGRLIQRPYDSFEEYVMGQVNSAEEDRETRYTDAGRKVLGGGGIAPDIDVSLREPTRFESALDRRAVYFDFAIRYLADERKKVEKRGVKVTQEVLNSFRDFVREKEIEHTDEEWKESQDHISLMIRAEILGALNGMEERQKVLIGLDLQIQKALEVIPAAERMPIVALELDGLKAASDEDPDAGQKARSRVIEK